MPKLKKKAIRYVQTDVRTDPNYRKASLLEIINIGKYKGTILLYKVVRLYVLKLKISITTEPIGLPISGKLDICLVMVLGLFILSRGLVFGYSILSLGKVLGFLSLPFEYRAIRC